MEPWSPTDFLKFIMVVLLVAVSFVAVIGAIMLSRFKGDDWTDDNRGD